MATLNYQDGRERKYERGPILRKLFGPSQREIWQLLAQGMGAHFDPGAWNKPVVVVAEVGEWRVTLDTFVIDKQVFTRMRAPYINRDGLWFRIYRASIFTSLGKMLGMQDIQIGAPEFDDDFVIKSNNQPQIRRFLDDPRLRRMIAAQGRISLEVRESKGWFGARLPMGADELQATHHGIVKNLDQLEQMFELFGYALHRLCHIGSAYEDDPDMPR